MKKFIRIWLFGLVLATLPGCAITPKWSKIQQDTTVPLETFKPDAIIKNEEETDPRYKEHRYDYRSTIDGIPAADASFWLKINRDNSYQVRTEFNIIAPWTFVLNAVGRQQVKGKFINGKFVPRQMSALYKVGDRKWQVTVTYPTGGGAPITILDPPRNSADITPIDKKLLAQSYDLTSALLTLMAQYKKSGQAVACNQQQLVWDGFRLARIKLYPDKTDAGLCTADFQRVGGFLRKFEDQAKYKPATLSFTVDKRFALPVVISADTFVVQPRLAMTAIDGTPLSYYYLPANINKTPFDQN